MNRYRQIVFVAMVAFLLMVAPAPAQSPTDDQVNSVAEQMNCPTCQSLNLADCRTQTCEQWRAQISDLLAEGYTEQEVLEMYALRYGDEVLQEPPRRGGGLLVWLLPALGVLGGSMWLGFVLKKWSAVKTPVAAETSAPAGVETDAYLKQVEQDLRNL